MVSEWYGPRTAEANGLCCPATGNNCICSDSKIGEKKFYEGDVNALRSFGFDSWKLDGCGAQTDMQVKTRPFPDGSTPPHPLFAGSPITCHVASI